MRCVTGPTVDQCDSIVEFDMKLGFTYIAAFTAVAALGACEHPTAPKATAKAEQLEQQLVSGDISQLQGALSDMLLMASSQAYAPAPLLPSATARVSRNGRSEVVHATV